MKLLLCLANLPYKFLCQYQRLGNVSSNFENVQNLAVLQGFITASLIISYAIIGLYVLVFSTFALGALGFLKLLGLLSK